MRICTGSLAMGMALAAVTPHAAWAADRDVSAYRGWVQAMKQEERGPFERIRWFCNDGAVLPPKAACSGHGGGKQHGELNARARELREQGYFIANVLAGSDPQALVESPDFRTLLSHLLIEKYLVSADDGWILRQALFYRGALQEEDEREAARALLTEMAAREEWIGPAFPALRVAARLLPHGADSAPIQKVRQLSASLAGRDAAFKPYRSKIHVAPGAEDAAAVRAYARGLAQGRRAPYLELAAAVDQVYQPAPFDRELRQAADRFPDAPWLSARLDSAAQRFGPGASAAQRFNASAGLLADLRDALPRLRGGAARLELIDLGLRAEGENFRAASAVLAEQGLSRAQCMDLLRAALLAAHGTGLINSRLLGEGQHALASLGHERAALDAYLDLLNYLGRAPGWGTQVLRRHFFESMQKLAEIEPMAMLFIQDQLRGSPLLALSRTLDRLTRDANRLGGVTHRLFGEQVGVGLTALNQGLAQGVLHVQPDLDGIESFRSDGIYLLPETVSDLPPVAGILTGGEGNPLSHVQLLARNLGIPNVTVDDAIMARLAAHDGERIVLAVSKSGLVEISAWAERWEPVFAQAEAAAGVVIEPDLEKLDLETRRFVSLNDLRAADSGRSVGPKAAKLGELRAHYPARVARGLAIPFGLFRQEALERPHPGGGGSVFDWMVANYRALAGLPEGSAERARRTEAFRAELHGIISATVPSEAFRQALRAAMVDNFGSARLRALFVRSDTNVEDLAGFTGAGLNLTLPNVVGFEKLLRSIVQVWASPFTARAYAWRQSHMTRPEHVYTSILLLESVAADKSGVLVTQDIDTGSRATLSVAVNEGVGGAVDGQAAESLRIPLDGSRVRVLATATAPWRRELDPLGGLWLKPASGSDTVLSPAEVTQLIDFARQLPATFPPITDAEGNPAPADVEFGFVNGEMRLFQLRPFLESKAARGISYLFQMESRLAGTAQVAIDLRGVPGQ